MLNDKVFLIQCFIFQGKIQKRKKNQYLESFSPGKGFLKEKPQSRLKEQLMQSSKIQAILIEFG